MRLEEIGALFDGSLAQAGWTKDSETYPSESVAVEDSLESKQSFYRKDGMTAFVQYKAMAERGLYFSIRIKEP